MYHTLTPWEKRGVTAGIAVVIALIFGTVVAFTGGSGAKDIEPVKVEKEAVKQIAPPTEAKYGEGDIVWLKLKEKKGQICKVPWYSQDPNEQCWLYSVKTAYRWADIKLLGGESIAWYKEYEIERYDKQDRATSKPGKAQSLKDEIKDRIVKEAVEKISGK